MVEDSDNLFELGGWDALDEFSQKLENKECFPVGSSDGEIYVEETEDDGGNPSPLSEG